MRAHARCETRISDAHACFSSTHHNAYACPHVRVSGGVVRARISARMSASPESFALASPLTCPRLRNRWRSHLRSHLRVSGIVRARISARMSASPESFALASPLRISASPESFALASPLACPRLRKRSRSHLRFASPRLRNRSRSHLRSHLRFASPLRISASPERALAYQSPPVPSLPRMAVLGLQRCSDVLSSHTVLATCPTLYRCCYLPFFVVSPLLHAVHCYENKLHVCMS